MRLLIFTVACAAMLWCRFGVSESTATDAEWLARSCIGEAGWNAWETGECAAILHIYRKRALITGESTTQLARRYSAAIKPHSGSQNRWVRQLLLDAKKPKKWPPSARWERYRPHWVMTMILAELFLQGMVEDPTPAAMHYGSKYDIPPPGAVRVKTEFRNRFYRME